mmetsp:Transcript_62403/g.103800  ORF Transcript_62403/g.103800 Transcript_62403/m.103800 type:complete len:237 (+) Transcript_62403:59-769(+)|eukprot:CAMPEP_0119297930 /NCGR_PEP_ID=MMETSP1333-20130426/123_1 /TAXON_ID=418940 /ORGANISM="Scyphosphaera apsteinii, Strain RCC1455" /LENGTH=236 /DNA_ID=CAMNT_0007298895 /DNA_START=35 /DNA_END=745 /DNA_ORIENTATION=+
MVFALRRSTVASSRLTAAVMARSIRTSAPALSEVAKAAPTEGALTTIDPSKFVDGESLVAHQARVRHDNPANRTFNYAMIGGSRFVGATVWRALLIKALAQMNPSADVLAMSSLEVDISNLKEGQCMTVKWRGKPVFVKSRTEAEIEEAVSVDMSELRDPESDADRALKPETLIVLGVCTHLGCVPITGAGDYNGWFCPCHGSHYDTSGRIRKGPAPLNLEIPPYEYLDDSKIVLG